MNSNTLILPWLVRAVGTGHERGELDIRVKVNETGELFVALDEAGKEFQPAGLRGNSLAVYYGRSLTLDTAVAEQICEIAQAWQVYLSMNGSMFDPRRCTAVFVHEHEAARFASETGWQASYLVLTETPLGV